MATAKISPPTWRDALVDKFFRPSRRVAQFFQEIVDRFNLEERQYVEGTDFDVTGQTGSNLSVVRGVLIPYKSVDGKNRVKGNFDFDHSSTSTLTISITGLEFYSASTQTVIAVDSGTPQVSPAWTSGSTIRVEHGAGCTETQIFVDGELEDDPTWI